MIPERANQAVERIMRPKNAHTALRPSEVRAMLKEAFLSGVVSAKIASVVAIKAVDLEKT